MPQIITAIELQKKRKDRVNVYINEVYSFSLPLWAAGSLKKGDPIAQSKIDELKYLDNKDKAFQRAVSYLAIRPRSRKEIRQHLGNKGFVPDSIESAIERLEHYGYINDSEFARLWIETRRRQRPRGTFGLRYELRQKGISEEIIENALKGYDEPAAAWDAVAPRIEKWQKLPEMEIRRKIYNFLKQRGFSGSTIRTICEQALIE